MCAEMEGSQNLSGEIPQGEKFRKPSKSKSMGMYELSIYLSMYLVFSDLSSKTMSQANNQMSPPLRSVIL